MTLAQTKRMFNRALNRTLRSYGQRSATGQHRRPGILPPGVQYKTVKTLSRDLDAGTGQPGKTP